MVPGIWLWLLFSVPLPPGAAIAFSNQVLSSAAFRCNRRLVACTQVGEAQTPRLISHKLACLKLSDLSLCRSEVVRKLNL